MGARLQTIMPADVTADGHTWHGAKLCARLDGSWHLYALAKDYPEYPVVDAKLGIVELWSSPTGRLRPTGQRRVSVLVTPEGQQLAIVHQGSGCLPCSSGHNPLVRFTP